jgi:superfamily II DNA or RNA helicase
MSVISATCFNTVHARIMCEPGIAREIQEYFTFDVPNAKFTPAYKNRYWDGKIRLFSPFNGLLYIGLLDYLAAFAKERNYTLQLDKEFTEKPPQVTDEQIGEFLQSLKLNAHGKPINPHSHQIAAISAAINRERALLLSPTASGKSLVIYSLLRWYQDIIPPDRKILIVVPTISLVTQMKSDFADYAQNTDWDAETNCHSIFGGQQKIDSRQIVISTWQSIYELPKSYFDQFEVVIGDEAHLFKAQSLTSIMTKLTKCPYRIALTGTLDGTKTNKLTIEGLFGPTLIVTTTKDLIDNNLLSTISIDCIVLNYPSEVCKTLKEASYQDELEFLVTNPLRNKFITKLALSTKGNTLVLFQFVEKHGKPLYEMIQKKAKGRPVFFIHGETEADYRESVRLATEGHDNAIIVASYGTFSTGINIRSLKNIVFASPSKSRIRVLQSIGRQLRKSEKKDKAQLYDISDDLRWKTRKNHTLKHFVERVKIYSEEGFPYKLIKLPIVSKNI